GMPGSHGRGEWRVCSDCSSLECSSYGGTHAEHHTPNPPSVTCQHFIFLQVSPSAAIRNIRKQCTADEVASSDSQSNSVHFGENHVTVFIEIL
ncbi:MAG: hypothetical protein ACK58T_04930, partial [Phycisphaerae bacterium]